MKKYIIIIIITTMSYSFTGFEILGENYINSKTNEYLASGYTDIEARVLLKEEARERVNMVKEYLGKDVFDAFVKEGVSFENMLWYVMNKKKEDRAHAQAPKP